MKIIESFQATWQVHTLRSHQYLAHEIETRCMRELLYIVCSSLLGGRSEAHADSAEFPLVHNPNQASLMRQLRCEPDLTRSVTYYTSYLQGLWQLSMHLRFFLCLPYLYILLVAMFLLSSQVIKINIRSYFRCHFEFALTLFRLRKNELVVKEHAYSPNLYSEDF